MFLFLSFREGDKWCRFSGKSLVCNSRTGSTSFAKKKQKPLPQPISEEPVACQACNDDDGSKNRKCDEEDTWNHLAPLSHSQRLLLERFRIVLMMPMVVMVGVFVMLMPAGCFSCNVHWLNIVFFLDRLLLVACHFEGDDFSYIIRAVSGTIRSSILALRFHV